MTKFIRTGEGILVFAFNVAAVVVPIVSNALTPTEAIKWAGILDGVALVARTGLKMVSLSKPVTGVDPPSVDQELVNKLADAVAPLVTQVAKDTADQHLSVQQIATQVGQNATNIEDAVSDIEEFASAPNGSGGASAQGAVLQATQGTTQSSSGPDLPVNQQAAPADASSVSDAEEFASVPNGSEDAGAMEPNGAAPGAPAASQTTQGPSSIDSSANQGAGPGTLPVVSDDEEFASAPPPDEFGEGPLVGVGGTVNGQPGMPMNADPAGQ